MFYNSGNYGLPLAALAFPGPPARRAGGRPTERDGAAVQAFVVFAMNLLTFTVGLGIAAWAGTGEWKRGDRDLLPPADAPGRRGALLARGVGRRRRRPRTCPSHRQAGRISRAGPDPAGAGDAGRAARRQPPLAALAAVSMVLFLRLVYGPAQMAALLYGFHLLGWKPLDLWGRDAWPAASLILTAGVPTAVNTLLLVAGSRRRNRARRRQRLLDDRRLLCHHTPPGSSSSGCGWGNRGTAACLFADSTGDSRCDRSSRRAASSLLRHGATAAEPAARKTGPLSAGPPPPGSPKTPQPRPPGTSPANKNVKWKTPVPGLGLFLPVIWGDRLFVTTAAKEGEEQKLQGRPLRRHQAGGGERRRCSGRSSASTGTPAKSCGSRRPTSGVPKIKRHPKCSHANPTVATDGEHVVAFFGSEGLYCYDLDGKLLWKKDLGVLDSGYYMVPDAQWGFASSPVIHDGKVIVQCDVQKDSFLAVFDLKTGEEVWRTPRKDYPTWCTPTVYAGRAGRHPGHLQRLQRDGRLRLRRPASRSGSCARAATSRCRRPWSTRRTA